MIKRFLLSILLLSLPLLSSAGTRHVVNVYAWSGYIPGNIIRQFENETGIKVNFSTYENNEVMYAKLRATKNPGYDVITPSGYFIDRMRREGLIEKIDKKAIPNAKYLDPALMHLPFDPHSDYSLPFLWGTTGIFYNSNFFTKAPTKWLDLWNENLKNQLLLLDDPREVFSIALLALGYPANDRNPEHIKAAFLKLKDLLNNVKVFSSDTVISIIIDEDATIGMAWNGDEFKASQENPAIHYVYPEEGFIISVDNLAIPSNPPHRDEANQFINFLLRPEVAKEIALFSGYPTADLAGQKLLPEAMRNNPTIYPPKSVLKHGQYQIDLGDETVSLYEKYWETLKMGG